MPKRLLLATLALVLLLAACGTPPEEIRPTPISAGGGEGGGAADEGGGVGGPVVLRLWLPQNDAQAAAYTALVAAYTAANPDVTIQLEAFDPANYRQTIDNALSAGGAADIIQLPDAWLCGYANGGALAEAPASIPTAADAAAAFYPAALGGFVCGDRLYGLPLALDLPYGVALVNRTTAESAGLANVAAGWASWDELIAAARGLSVVQDGGMGRAGLHFASADALPAMFYSLILQNGGQYLSGGAFTVNTPQGLAALGQMKRLVDEGALDATRFHDAADPAAASFFDGRSAMAVLSPAAATATSAARPDVAAIAVALPAAGAQPAVVGAGLGLAVSRTSAAQEVAWDFVRFAALDPANAAAWSQAAGALPALRAAGEGAAAEQLVARHPLLGAWLPLLPVAQHAGAFADRDRAWRDVTYPRLLAFLQGAATAEATLAAIQSEITP